VQCCTTVCSAVQLCAVLHNCVAVLYYCVRCCTTVCGVVLLCAVLYTYAAVLYNL